MEPAPRRPLALSLSAQARAPLSIAVARQLRELIVSGQVGVGEELPSEKDLSRQLQVGRSTIREALRILQAQGLLSGGDTVSTARPRVSVQQTLTSAAHTMENALRLGQVSLDELVALRVVIEGAIVDEAAARGPSAALDDAGAAIAIMKRPDIDIETFRAADLRFHRSLSAACGNTAFTLVMSVLRDAISAHLGEALERVPQPRKAMATLAREHEAIYEAVVRGHGKRARTLITAHIRGFYSTRSAR